MNARDVTYLAEFRELEDAVQSLLDGHGPSMQGAILSDLVATWLAGHPADRRQWLLDRHMFLVERMIPVNEAALFGEAGNPLNGSLADA